jgi:hypothetical protein
MDRRDGCPDGLALLEAASLVQLPWDARPGVPSAWDALAGAHLVLMEGALHPDRPGADAEKSAGLELDAPEPDGW